MRSHEMSTRNKAIFITLPVESQNRSEKNTDKTLLPGSDVGKAKFLMPSWKCTCFPGGP